MRWGCFGSPVWIKRSPADGSEQEVLEGSTLWKIRSFFTGAGYDPITAPGWITLVCRYRASLSLTRVTYGVQPDPDALRHITHIFSPRRPSRKEVFDFGGWSRLALR